MTNNNSGTILGHPKGLYVLFFTELWERFSFYGMKALLILYMLNHYMWSQEQASSLLGWYGFLVYGTPLIGGILADQVLGQRRAITLGAILLSVGHLCMAFADKLSYFYAALGLIIAGVALLKPNISTQVGSLYKPGDPRRDGAFTIFYMGINLGGFFGPIVCDWLRVNYGFHYGFSAAGVGMFLGLIVYILGQRTLVEFQQDADTEEEPAAKEEIVPAHPPHVIRDRVIVIGIVCLFQVVFWTGFEQSPNAMMVWADQHTNLRLTSSEPRPIALEESTPISDTGEVETAGFIQSIQDWFTDPAISSGQTQSINGFFIITLAPVVAFLWLWLGRRNRQPSTPTKMVMGLVFIMIAFGFMWPAAQTEGGKSSVRLTELPEQLEVDEQGRVYSTDEEDPSSKTYYGATRLHYDQESRELKLSGVLPDLDRLRLLEAASPEAFKQGIAELVALSEEKEKELGSRDWEVGLTLSTAPDNYRIIGDQAKKVVKSWDAETKTITVKKLVNARARVELHTMAADREFKAAIDQLYLTSSDFRVSVWWLIGFYLFLTVGELCVSPVGLSMITKLAPAKHVGMFMGLWFLSSAISEKTAHMIGAYWGKLPPGQYFLLFVAICGIGALLMSLFVPAMKRMMHGAD